jgi:predicted TIM-barrel fold metal-dependent hydrolase
MHFCGEDRLHAGRLIVDAQVHLWLAESPQRPWPPGGRARAQLPYPFTCDMLLPMMDEAGVDRAVIVPPSFEGNRNDYALEAVRKYPSRFAVMGRIALNDPTCAARIPGWRDQPGMLGFRVTFLNTQASWLTDGTADWFWPAVEKAGIPVMFLAADMAGLAPVAERHPALTIVIDHMGLSGEAVKAGRRDSAIDTTVALARFPNVSVKLSSAPAYSSEPYPFRDMTPYLRRVLEAYGPQRCYWGTDITNSLAKANYRQRIEHFSQELDFLSEADRDLIMGRGLVARLQWT